MPKYERHVFICVNERADDHAKGSCASCGGKALREAFKLRIKEAGLAERVRANKAGCLDACEHGATVVVYPEQVWYGGVRLADVAEIVERHLGRGEVVERLRIRDEEGHTPGNDA